MTPIQLGIESSQHDKRIGWTTLCKQWIFQASVIGVDATDSVELGLQKRLIVWLSIGLLPLTLLWSVTYAAAGAPLSAAIPGLYTVIVPVNTAVFAWTRNIAVFRFIQLSIFLFLPWLLMMSLGGFKNSSVVIIWAALCPLAALLLDDLRQSVSWIFGYVWLLIVSAVLQPYLLAVDLPPTFVTWLFVLNVGAVVVIAFAVLYYFVTERNYFQERSETLLLNILPKEISEALKAKQMPIASEFEATSILFADVVDFTSVAATMTALSLVELLNEVFQCFDDLVAKYGLEKIKTIGDCYMVAAGVPRACPDHAERIVALALDMQTEIARRRFGGRELALRIGINSGPVVAGVIGHKKFTYDLWGDAVNMASRMESQGRSRATQITRSTYQLIQHDFVCEAQGTISVKGAGQTEIWHVLRRKVD